MRNLRGNFLYTALRSFVILTQYGIIFKFNNNTVANFFFNLDALKSSTLRCIYTNICINHKSWEIFLSKLYFSRSSKTYPSIFVEMDQILASTGGLLVCVCTLTFRGCIFNSMLELATSWHNLGVYFEINKLLLGREREREREEEKFFHFFFLGASKTLNFLSRPA